MHNVNLYMHEELLLGMEMVVLDGVLSSDECLFLTKAIDNNEHLSFWSSANDKTQLDSARQFRNADTIELISPSLAESIWGRISATWSDIHSHKRDGANIVIPEEDSAGQDGSSMWERELVGDWCPAGLNPNILLARYPSGGHFAPHTDGRAILNFNVRSFYSVIVFLNDIPLASGGGGGTRFYRSDVLKSLELHPTLSCESDSDSTGAAEVAGAPTGEARGGTHWTGGPSTRILAEVEARAGRVLLFDQRLVHEGVVCVPPWCTYIIRSDVMFRRTPETERCAAAADLLAYSVFQEAERLADIGDADGAILLFKKAFKASP